MQFTIILEGSETPAQLAKVRAAVNAYCDASGKSSSMDLEIRVDSSAAILELEKFKRAVGSLDIPESVGEKLEVELVNRDDETLAKLEAENPQFGKQPLPEGAVGVASGDGSGLPLPPHIDNEAHTSGPLAPPSPPSAPSPAAAAPSTSVPAAPPGSSVDVDKNGLPWDERIHASSRAKIADGSWRMKRGVQQHVVDTVERELRTDAAYVHPSEQAAPPAPPAPPGPPAPPAAPVAGAGLTFGQLAKRVGAKITLGELTAQDLAARMAALGFPGGLHEASARPDMWATILETLGA